ncbi:MAG TPA: tannase/feruloyl esterase family alpha/beta hydrolase [Acidimicrobiales bacterium]|nr:tannase/feruloyl esterase family alpha/beta hydrolase [Acidimicrobiales bacterium]
MTTGTSAIETSSYAVTDPFFGPPFIEIDEERAEPYPHRFVQGGFERTTTRFAFYFPPQENYAGRMFQPLEGGNGGHVVTFGGGYLGEMFKTIESTARLGGYLVESNQGHIGDQYDPRAGADPTLYGHRASAEVARFSKYVAAQVYGSAPHHSYIYGGSGGGRRSPLCIENAPGVWDGCLPSASGGEIGPPGNTQRIRTSSTMGFGTLFNVQRLLGYNAIVALADRMAPGGSGDPFEGLTTHQREELALLYRQGFPRGNEFMISQPMGQIWLWSSLADALYEDDPSYFEDFWTEPGYVAHDQPDAVAGDVIDSRGTVVRTISARELNERPEFAGPEHHTMRVLSAIMGTGADDLPFAIEVAGLEGGHRLGAGLRIVSGKAAGRQLYATGVVGDVFACDGTGDANVLRFEGVQPGDEVHVDNRRFLAYCYYARHHLLDEPQFDSLRVDGVAVYPQHPTSEWSPFMGVCYSGQYEGKVMWVHSTHDSSVWPAWGTAYHRAVLQAQGPAGAAANFRIRWNEFAEHATHEMVPPEPHRASSTRFISGASGEQNLQDLVDWVEHGIEPLSTEYSYEDGRITLPPTVHERRGIQPIAVVSANGSVLAEVEVGAEVELAVQADVHPEAGTIVNVEWDFDGSGTYPYSHAEVDGRSSSMRLSARHTYDRPGVYFATARVESHRTGDLSARERRIQTLGQARVVVR